MSIYNVDGRTTSSVYDINGNSILSAQEKFINGRLVLFEDDFNGNYLNAENWLAENRNSFGNNTIQFYTSRPENVRVENSNLILTARRESYKGKEWTSAQVVSRGLQEFKYGRFEARIKMPNEEGMWPAFWMLGRTWYSSDAQPIPWAECGEIDILEYSKKSGYINAQPIYNIGNGIQQSIWATKTLDVTDYHVYALEWTNTGLAFLVDDVQFGNTYDIANLTHSTTGYKPFANPFFLLISMQVGGAAGTPTNETPDTNEMHIDWVRVLAPEGVTERIYPTSITVTGTVDTLAVGESADLIAYCEPESCTEQTLTWESENQYRTQNRGGHITKLQNEPCSVIAKAKNGVQFNYVVP